MALEKHDSIKINLLHQHINPLGDTLHVQTPPCANCGKPLSSKQEEMELRCHYCGHQHHFLPFDATHEDLQYQTGDAVAVEWGGHWWPAYVTTAHKKTKTWRIHFVGWSPAFDAEVGSNRIHSIGYITDMPVTTVSQKILSPASEPTVSPIKSALFFVFVLLTFLCFASLVLMTETMISSSTFNQMYPPVLTPPTIKK